MHALVEEYARRAVQLGYDDTLGAVDDERSCRSHVRDVPEIDFLDHRVEILMFGIGAGKAQLGLERYVVGESSVQALFD